MMKKKRKKRTRTGSDACRFTAAALAALLFLLPASFAAFAAQRKAPASYALIVGTVFRDSGMSLPGAQLTLRALGDSQEARRFKKMQATSGGRGEFAFHVPQAPMRYVLSVKASGYREQEKIIEIPAQDGQDVFFRLDPASKR
jgi:hypothetical protein